jgi:hypothetical protein
VLAKMRDAVTMLSFKLMVANRFGSVPVEYPQSPLPKQPAELR